jgi:hypothetical protein
MTAIRSPGDKPERHSREVVLSAVVHCGRSLLGDRRLHAAALHGQQIPVYPQPSTFGYASDAVQFRGHSINAWIMGLVAVGALSAWLYDLWGIQPLFALLNLLHVGGS